MDIRGKELPDDYLFLGGNLQLPKGATPQDHAKVRRAFKQILRRAKVKHGRVLEVFAQRHSTTIHDCHWDIAVYTDLPKTVAKSIILDSWSRAGGGHKAVKLIAREQFANWVRYVVKDDPFAEAEDDGVQLEHDKKLIPAKRSVCGLNNYWGTDDFWGGRNVEDYWSDYLDLRYPERVERRSNSSITESASNPAPGTPPEFDPSDPATYQEVGGKIHLDELEHRKDLTPFQVEVCRRYLALKRDPERDSGSLRQTLPDSPHGALGAAQIAGRMGWDVDYTKGLLEGLESQGRASRTDGHLVGGVNVYGTWFRV